MLTAINVVCKGHLRFHRSERVRIPGRLTCSRLPLGNRPTMWSIPARARAVYAPLLYVVVSRGPRQARVNRRESKDADTIVREVVLHQESVGVHNVSTEIPSDGQVCGVCEPTLIGDSQRTRWHERRSRYWAYLDRSSDSGACESTNSGLVVDHLAFPIVHLLWDGMRRDASTGSRQDIPGDHRA